MRTIVSRALSLVLPILVVSAAGAVGVVREFSGTDSVTTADFEVTAPWIIDWRSNGDFPAMLGFEVSLIDATTGMHVGQVAKVVERAGNGVSLFGKSGRYRLRINSTLARWHIKVEEISAEDAKLYTPK
ncbi:MAG TPA: hypothetical protein VLB07_07870 [Woeseiaceae bacterium]|nr:hypothetical protein [Woeseiaceae bacterium]